jgi:hypothetical protein
VDPDCPHWTNGSTVRCRSCSTKSTRKWFAKTPGEYAIQRRMQVYKLDRQQAEVSLVSAQGDFCRSCRKFDRLVLDHDHKTGRPRAMVCPSCNSIAGGLESPKRNTVETYLKEAANDSL